MTKLNITITVPAEALPSLMNDLPVYCAELVKVEQPQAPAAAPKVAAQPSRTRRHGRQTSALEVYRTACDLYRETQTPFRSADIWRALRADGTFATKEAVYQHLQRIRQMGLIEAVSGTGNGGGYGNVVVRYVDDEMFEALYREHLYA